MYQRRRIRDPRRNWADMSRRVNAPQTAVVVLLYPSLSTAKEIRKAQQERMGLAAWKRMRVRQENARKKRRAAEIEAFLVEVLGKQCHKCGSVDRLSFDHPQGRDYDPAKMNRLRRLKRYLIDWKAGNLQLACIRCNSTWGAFWRHRRDPRRYLHGR